MNIKRILRGRTFFNNLNHLVQVLKYVKEAVIVLQSDKTNLADCFINLVKLAAIIKKILIEFHKNFYSYCINKFNER